MKDFFLRLYKSKSFYRYRNSWYLLGICFLFVLLRIPSLIEPHWYGDEGIYQVIGRAIVSGQTLYKDVWDNKPPLLYLIYALVNGNLYFVKLLSLFSGLFSTVMFLLLAKKLFTNPVSYYLSTLLFSILFGLPILEGNIANAENFMLLPIIGAAYLVLSYQESKKRKYLIFAGLLLAIAVITKIVAVFDFVTFLLFLLFSSRVIISNQNVRKTIYFLVPTFSLLFISLLLFTFLGIPKEFIKAVFLQNVSYVGEQNSFIFPMGILIIKTVLLIIGLVAIFLNRKRISKTTLFIFLWTILSLYNAFFSERPYIHYSLVMLPAFALLIGELFEEKKLKLLNVFAIGVISYFAYFHFQIYLRSIPYYKNYLKFITNKESIVDYEAFFDRNTPRDYDIANFIRMNIKRNDMVYLWSDSAQIYALSDRLPIGKYVVAYHVTFYKNADKITKEQLEKVRPKYIIQTIDVPLVDNILSSYQLKFIMEGTKIYEREI
jgi:hypothetical protein